MDNLNKETKEVVYTMRMKNGHPKEIWGSESDGNNSLLFGRIDPLVSYIRLQGLASGVEAALAPYGDFKEATINLDKTHEIVVDGIIKSVYLASENHLNETFEGTNAISLKVSRTDIDSKNDRYDSVYTMGIKTQNMGE